MAKRKPVPINIAYIKPANLTMAIEQSGQEREAIAAAIKVSPDALTAWESPDEIQRPTFEQAATLSKQLGVPLGALFLSKPAQRKLTIPDRRSLGVLREPSPNFRRLLNDVLVRRDWFRQYAIEKELAPFSYVGSVASDDDVAKVASDIRRTIRLTPSDRHSAYHWSDYLGRVAYRAEEAGVLVMRSAFVGNDTRRRVERTEVQGFAVADPYAPVVFVNTSDFVTAQVFTLAHELAHIWIGDSAISNPDEGDSARDKDKVETRCNAIATELLVPKRDFVIGWNQTVPSDRVRTLVRRYWVSARVILRRARELNLLSFDEYQLLRERAIADEKKRGKGGGTYFDNAATRAGHRLTDAVLSEVNRGAVTIPEGASLLAMKIHTFARFAEMGQ